MIWQKNCPKGGIKKGDLESESGFGLYRASLASNFCNVNNNGNSNNNAASEVRGVAPDSVVANHV